MTGRSVVWFQGGPTDRWHQWAMRDDPEEAAQVGQALLDDKGVHDAMVTVEGEHPADQTFVLREFDREITGRAHHCMTDPDAGFPAGLPDVGRAGTTWDRDGNVIGPWFHPCATCGERYHWHEVVGFVGWYLPDDVDHDTAQARIAAATPSVAEAAGSWEPTAKESP